MLKNYVISRELSKTKTRRINLGWFQQNILIRYDQKTLYLKFQSESVILSYKVLKYEPENLDLYMGS